MDDKTRQELSVYLDNQLLNYANNLLEDKQLKITITKPRKTKFGDYRYNRLLNTHEITINQTKNIYAFRITFFHELAHFLTYDKYGFGIKPHGSEWKSTYKILMLPLLNEQFFPKNLLPSMIDYFENPKARTNVYPGIYKELHSINKEQNNAATDLVHLHEIPQETPFELNGRRFVKKYLRRTNVFCFEPSSGRNYLINQFSLVKRLIS